MNLKTDKPPFWVIWSPRGLMPRKRHASIESATTEADRLSKSLPGRHFYVLEMKGYAMEGDEQPTKRQQQRAAANQTAAAAH